MKSAFPGMDPYLESHWGDIHARLMVYASNQINSQLPDDLQARVEESVSVEFDDLEDEPRTQRHLEIVDLSDGGRVVTVIEILSPANKIGDPERQLYVQKQRQYLDARVNLFEIDLLRQGDFVLAAPEQRIPSA